MRPLNTVNLETIRRWCRAYSEKGPAKRNTEQAYGIGIYQLGQAQRWRDDKLTVAESAASAFLWWGQCSVGLRIDPWKLLPPDLTHPEMADSHFGGWAHVFNLMHRMQQQVIYGAVSEFSGRNKRFDSEKAAKLMAGLMVECVTLMRDNVEEGFYEASNILLGRG